MQDGGKANGTTVLTQNLHIWRGAGVWVDRDADRGGWLQVSRSPHHSPPKNWLTKDVEN